MSSSHECQLLSFQNKPRAKEIYIIGWKVPTKTIRRNLVSAQVLAFTHVSGTGLHACLAHQVYTWQPHSCFAWVCMYLDKFMNSQIMRERWLDKVNVSETQITVCWPFLKKLKFLIRIKSDKICSHHGKTDSTLWMILEYTNIQEPKFKKNGSSGSENHGTHPNRR